MRRWYLLLLTALAMACDDPAGVCDAPNACQVSGVDLAIARVELLNPLGTDPATGLDEASREPRVRYVIRNRGTITSAPRWLDGSIELQSTRDSALLPSIPPGDSVVDELGFAITAPYLVYGGFSPRLEATGQRAHLSIRQDGALRDSDSSNDTASAAFVPAVATLELRVSDLPVPRLRVNEAFTVRVSAHNRSRHESLPSLPIAVCMWDEDVSCQPAGPALTGRFTLPALPPGDSLVEDRTFAIEPAAVWQDEAWRYGFSLVILPSGWSDAYSPGFELASYVFGSGVRVRPDYEGACSPPILNVGETAVFVAPNCGLLPSTSQSHPWQGPGGYDQQLLAYRFHLVGVELVAGGEYRLTASSGVVRPSLLLDTEGERAGTIVEGGFSVPRSGRYYLVLHGRPADLAVTLGTR